jgi:hypothetical protein
MLTPMQRERVQTLLRRLMGLGLLAVSLVFLTVGAWYRWSGPALEVGLSFVTGPAKGTRVEPWRSSRQKGEMLSFVVGDRRVSYYSSRPGYRQLVAAAQTGAPITVGYGPVGLPFGLRAHATKLYTISVGGQTIRSYADEIAEDQGGSLSSLVLGGVLLAVALVLLWPRPVRLGLRGGAAAP